LSRALPGSKSICQFFIALGGLYFALGGLYFALGGLYFALGDILFLQLHALADEHSLVCLLGSVAEGPKFPLQNILTFMSKFFVGPNFSPVAEGFLI
jgi:hypothetical protein